MEDWLRQSVVGDKLCERHKFSNSRLLARTTDIIEGYHHDGHDRYEIKQLTKKGYELARSYGFDKDRHLHNTIMNCNIFSKLPRLATL